jgi:aryl-alcohol dehydrogenase-like predicted oxidoreductase
MLQRPVGSRGPEVGVIGLGGMALSSIYHPTDDATALGQLQRAVELGVTHFDTSDAYGDGHNERLFGAALRPSRDSLFIATKFGNIRYPDGSRGVDGRGPPSGDQRGSSDNGATCPRHQPTLGGTGGVLVMDPLC